MNFYQALRDMFLQELEGYYSERLVSTISDNLFRLVGFNSTRIRYIQRDLILRIGDGVFSCSKGEMLTIYYCNFTLDYINEVRGNSLIQANCFYEGIY